MSLNDGEEIVIIPHDVDRIAESLQDYCTDLDRLYRLAANGQRAFGRVFGLEAQMTPRLAILQELVTEGNAAAHPHWRNRTISAPTVKGPAGASHASD